MNEYKIHQRFFDKLKQKAEKKKRDLEEKKEGKENIQKGERRSSLEAPQRKRSVPPTEKKAEVNKAMAVEQPGGAVAPNAVNSEVKDTGDLTSMNSSSENEAVSEEVLAKKRIKMSNGVDAGVNSSSSGSRSHMMGNGGENCYDGGISLAQFLAETLQSQTTEENLSSLQEGIVQEMETAAAGDDREKDTEEKQDKLKEREKQKNQEEELPTEKERARERQAEMKHTAAPGKQSSEVKHHGKAHKKDQKDHEHHHIQTSISSMLHTVKDFFFGKTKKDSHSHFENEDKGSYHADSSVQPPESDLPPSFQLHVEKHNPDECKQLTEEHQTAAETQECLETMDVEHQTASAEPLKPKRENKALRTDVQPDYTLFPKTEEKSEAKSEVGRDEEAMEVSVEPERRGAEEVKLPELQVHSEVRRAVSHGFYSDMLFSFVCFMFTF